MTGAAPDQGAADPTREPFSQILIFFWGRTRRFQTRGAVAQGHNRQRLRGELPPTASAHAASSLIMPNSTWTRSPIEA
jgi:hypothetical protein